MIGMSNGSNSKSTHGDVTPCAGAAERGGSDKVHHVGPSNEPERGCSLMQGSVPLVIR